MPYDYDLLIRAGQLIDSALPEDIALDIAVREGRIVALGEALPGSAAQTLDAQGLTVLPGVVDAHVHFNEPGRSHWEGIATGSAAHAAGGGTVFVDMPLNSHPPVLDEASFQAKLEAMQARSHCDFALWGGLTPDSLEHMDALAACGVIGFKAFMSKTGTDDFQAADDAVLYQGMTIAARHGLLVAVHAESYTLTMQFAQALRAQGRSDAAAYCASRPILAECEAISRALLLAKESGCALHVVHVSSAAGVALIAKAKAEGVNVTCETCPHYLHFSQEDLEARGAVLKCAPPLRPQTEVAALWQTLLEGTIDFIASDHSPCPPELKDKADFFDIWGGITGIQFSLPVMLSQAAQRGLPLAKLSTLMATAPAQRLRLANKGRIALGYDADLVCVDREASYSLSAADLRQRHPHSPYLGQPLQGRVQHTLLRGRSIYQNGQLGEAGSAKLLTPAPLP